MLKAGSFAAGYCTRRQIRLERVVVVRDEVATRRVLHGAVAVPPVFVSS